MTVVCLDASKRDAGCEEHVEIEVSDMHIKKMRVTRFGMRKESLDLSKRPLNSKRRQQRTSSSLLVYSHPISTYSVVIPESRDEISGICP
ncbi:hypothetical protein VCR31J2_1350071 [Vibrio coralliirubri]|uniref:Uncharacterized protein n=1 Tax=Vibrio coralliirubri TaxID=1516159 RepID=A0AA86WPU0_9VIBR|nr:hypothetical protein VCR31J2_1350071 [Vibrio coralliirubri]